MRTSFRRYSFPAATSAACRCTAPSTTPPRPARATLSGDRARQGDAITVNGPIGDHGVAILSLRENLSFGTAIQSDTAALHGLVAAMVGAVADIHVLRGPSRGGRGARPHEIGR